MEGAVASVAQLTMSAARTAAADLGPQGITVNMVSGGLLRTTDASKATPEAVFDLIAGMTPLRSVTTPEEFADAVLFFDEADALFGKRSEVRDAHDRYANIEVGYLLQRIESYAGLAILTTKPKWKTNVRLLALGSSSAVPRGARYVKNVLGGLLVQDYDTVGWDPAALKTVTKRAPTAAELADLGFAWLVCKHLKSNAICLAKDRELVGAGAGQMSRVNSTWIATTLAKQKAAGSVLASDAFFPFPDGVATAAAAGVRAIVQPGGSKGDESVIAEADKHGIAMVFTGVRHFRH